MSPFRVTRTLPEDATDAALRADVLTGLTATPKTLPPKWFYDARGSELFDHENDPHEFKNLAKDSAHGDTVAEMKRLLQATPKRKGR